MTPARQADIFPASSQYLKAGEWVVGKAKELGLENAQMESYGTFGRSWELQKFYAAMTAPQYMPLIAFPKAWTPGTNGVLKGNAVLLNVKKPADLDKYKGKLKDAIVLVQGERDLPISFAPAASRPTSTSTTAAARSAASTPRATAPRPRSSRSGSSPSMT